MNCVDNSFYQPQWERPENIGALMSVRTGGVSEPPWDSANVGALCGDAPAHVQTNRLRLAQQAVVPGAPRYLQQVHGAEVVEQHVWHGAGLPALRADGQITADRHLPLAILTADCLPVLMCDDAGQLVAAAHAGWRGLHAGVLPRILRELRARLPSGRRISAWIGPGIGPCCFEVGSDVREAFVRKDARYEKFIRKSQGTVGVSLGQPRYKADLSGIAALQLAEFDVSISSDGACTSCDALRFFSYRRDGVTGRMAAVVWRK